VDQPALHSWLSSVVRNQLLKNTEDMHMTNSPSYPDSNGDTGVGPDRGSPPSTPRWVKVFVIITIILVLLFVILQFVSGGEHGPRRHLPSGTDLGGPIMYSIVIEDQIAFSSNLSSHLPHSSFTGYRVQRL
jgi:hypothetical protein